MPYLKRTVYRVINSLFLSFGFSLVRLNDDFNYPVEFDKQDRLLLESIIKKQLSMASRERLSATIMACRHVCAMDIAGDFVECGVWRGGNSIAAADVFQRQSCNRTVFLFDTFTGMTEPGEFDANASDGTSALPEFMSSQQDEYNSWCYASIEDVRANFLNFDIDTSRVRLIKGDILNTLENPDNLPDKISVLRLDTDWFESTKKELEVLWPRLVKGGVLLIDDYGHWQGARKAVDEFFIGSDRPFFSYTDYTGRIAVKAE